MWKRFCQAELKVQILCLLVFMAGYAFPVLGVLVALGAKLIKKDVLYRRLPLLGAAIAMGFYVVGNIDLLLHP